MGERGREDSGTSSSVLTGAGEDLAGSEQVLSAALRDTLNMLRAAYMQLGMSFDDNKRVIKARAALAKAEGR